MMCLLIKHAGAVDAARLGSVRSGCCGSDVLGSNASASTQRFIEKNKPIQETPQSLCVSADVRDNDKVKY